MRKYLIKRCGKAVNSLLAYGGLKIQRKKSKKKRKAKTKKEDYIWQKISYLPQVPTLIDIGIGPEGTRPLYKHFPEARYVFIDPLEECKEAVMEYLGNRDNLFITTAVGSATASAVINVARKQSRSSLYKRTSYKSQAIEQREVSVRRLDDIVSELSLMTPFGVKIDTEGYELEVLKGSPETLQKALFFIVEFHFSDAMRNSYTLQDIISFMEDAGFAAHFMLRDGRSIVFINRNDSHMSDGI